MQSWREKSGCGRGMSLKSSRWEGNSGRSKIWSVRFWGVMWRRGTCGSGCIWLPAVYDCFKLFRNYQTPARWRASMIALKKLTFLPFQCGVYYPISQQISQIIYINGAALIDRFKLTIYDTPIECFNSQPSPNHPDQNMCPVLSRTLTHNFPLHS